MKKVELRPAKKQDCKVIWRWRNDKTTRKYSFNTEFIPYEKHKAWFENVLRNRNILMIEKDGSTVGVIRFDINSKDQIAEININIAPEKRRKGLGLLGIRSACKYAFKHLSVREIIAKIKKENVPSVKVFSRAGFDLIDKNEIITMRLTSR